MIDKINFIVQNYGFECFEDLFECYKAWYKNNEILYENSLLAIKELEKLWLYIVYDFKKDEINKELILYGNDIEQWE